MTLFTWPLKLNRSPRKLKSAVLAAPTLANVRPGGRARVVSFSPGIAPSRRAHLQAYGVIPGRWVQVVQHAPVTVIRVEHTELALETELAAEILVEVN